MLIQPTSSQLFPLTSPIFFVKMETYIPVVLLLLLACSNARATLPVDCLPNSPYSKCSHAATAELTNACLMACGTCNTAYLLIGLSQEQAAAGSFCGYIPGDAKAMEAVALTTASAIINVSAIQGNFWLDGPGGQEENATQAIQFLVRFV